MSKQKLGFTLAEVLITLAIIGIVAALTIPSVITNYQHTQYITSLKKTQSTLSKAAYMFVAQGKQLTCDLNNDGKLNNVDKSKMVKFYSGKDEPDIFREFRKNIQTVTAPDNDVLQNIKIYDINGNDINASHGYGGSVFLKDGSTYQMGILATDIIAKRIPKFYCYSFMVDVNGPFKKPNKIGYDVFAFILTENGRLIPAGADIPEINNQDCLIINNTTSKSWCVTSSAIKGANPDGTDYFKGIKYWNDIK